MGRARQIASAENMDRILLDASAASTDEGEHLLLDGSAASTDVGFFINTEIGTTETPPEGFVNTSSIAADAVDNTKIADEAVKLENLAEEATDTTNRNVIINGAMNVQQRGDATGLGASSAYVRFMSLISFAEPGPNIFATILSGVSFKAFFIKLCFLL